MDTIRIHEAFLCGDEEKRSVRDERLFGYRS